MPNISFNFSGYINDARITTATNIDGKTIDVSKMSAKELADALNEGSLFISLGDYLYENNRDCEIELTDFGVI